MGFGGAMFATAGAQAVGQIAGGYSQKSEADANATIVENNARYNAEILQEQANTIDASSNIEQGQYTRLKGQYLAKTTAAVAKQGVAFQGSAMAVALNTQTQISIDQAIAKFNSDTSKNQTIAASNQQSRDAQAQADALRRSGSQAVASGYSGAFSSLLQGGTSYLGYKYKVPKTTTFDYNAKAPSNTASYSTPNMSIFN